MGLPLEQWCGGEADGGSAGKEEASGCRTPSNGRKGARAAAESDCPAPPRKRRAAPGAVAQQQQRRDFYTGADVDAFFAAHNL